MTLRLLHLVAKVRKGPKTRRKLPAAATSVKMRELKLKRESEQTRVRTHKLD